MASVTVEEVNQAFASKGLYISLPLDKSVVVTGLEVMEMSRSPGYVKVLLRVKFLNERGRETQEIFLCEGKTDVKIKTTRKVAEPPKKVMLPARDRITFDTEEEALEYIKSAFSHLLEDKGFVPAQGEGSDFYFEREGKGFYIDFVLCFNEATLERARSLVELRRSLRQRAAANDFAIVAPAIQEQWGVPLRVQERWVQRNQEYLSVQRIGVYGVDNQDPNRIYPFSIYPTNVDLKRYFMIMGQQWALVRSRYVLERTKKED